jgi:integrase
MLLPLKAIISKKPRRDGNHLIYFQYCYSSTNRALLSTDIAIPVSAWNAKRQCISKSLPETIGNFAQLNEELHRLRKLIEAIIERGAALCHENIGAYVKQTYEPNLILEPIETTPKALLFFRKEPDFFSEFDDYIACKTKSVCAKGIANFRIIKQRLYAFETHRKNKITFSSLDYGFYSEMVDFLAYDYQLRRKKKPIFGLRTATIGKTINFLRMFVRDRVRRKRIAAVDMEDFKILDEEADAIYLSYEEIAKIYNLDLSSNLTFALYRDIFVLGCLTGLRFSDYSTLDYSDFRSGMLYKKTSKTDNWVVIPLREEAIEIFNRRFAGGTPKVSNEVFNRYIKEMGKLAGLTGSITFTHKKGNRDISITKLKAEWITSHTCRRSFCTNEYLAGTDISLIMKISGHKTHKQFFKYIRVTQEEAARKIQDIWQTRGNMHAFGPQDVSSKA